MASPTTLTDTGFGRPRLEHVVLIILSAAGDSVELKKEQSSYISLTGSEEPQHF